MSTPAQESKLIVTRDGSHTVYSDQFDQHYHNPNGAVAESRYVFFEQTGLLEDLKQGKDITILETGFGTGLNLMLLLDYYQQSEGTSQVHFYSVEGFPLDYEVALKLNYADHLVHPELIPEVITMFKNLSPGINSFTVLENISVHLFYGMFKNFDASDVGADYILHDAFSPDVNSDLWTGEVFSQLREASKESAILSTYCAASKARGAMAWAGWKVARAKGALGKREMTLAALDSHQLGQRKRVNEERLAHRYEEGDF